MQYAVFPMPHNPISSIDRRISFSTERLLWQIEPSAPFHCDYKFQDIRLGVESSDLPTKLYKAIYISSDSQWVFETVYTQERGLYRCIYVKMIGEETTIGIPLESVLAYSNIPAQLQSLSSILNEINWATRCKILAPDLLYILSPVYGREAIDREAISIMSAADDREFRNISTDRWAPLYYNEPGLLAALISGSFARAPHHEIQGICPFLTPLPRQFDDARSFSYRAKAFGGKIYYDQPEFDPVIIALLKLPIAEFSITVAFTDGLEGILNTGVMHHYHDPYQLILPRYENSREILFRKLGGIIQEALWTYSQVFDTDLYNRSSRIDKSYMMISKNIFDEIIIEYRDVHDATLVGIYGNLTSLALVTQDVGHRLKPM